MSADKAQHVLVSEAKIPMEWVDVVTKELQNLLKTPSLEKASSDSSSGSSSSDSSTANEELAAQIKFGCPIHLSTADSSLLLSTDKKLESMLCLMGTVEGKKMVEGLVGSTGFFYEYSMLSGEGERSPEIVCSELGLAKEYQTARAHALNAQKGHAGQFGSLSLQLLTALTMYTGSRVYRTVNDALRNSDEKVLMKYRFLIRDMILAIRGLPAYSGKVFRGTQIPGIHKCRVGGTVIFEALTSASISEQVACRFSRASDEGKTNVLFCIESQFGRLVRDLSLHPSEMEVVFRAYSQFKIEKIEQDVQIDGSIDDAKYVRVTMTEICGDLRGRKVLLWVDDLPLTNSNCELRNRCEKKGVTIVPLRSTREALDFLRKNEELLNRGNKRMRIVTDMARMEARDGGDGGGDVKKELIIDAGLRFVQTLKIKYGYKDPIVVFTGDRNLKDNQKKFESAKFSTSQVKVTATESDMLTFACFEDQ